MEYMRSHDRRELRVWLVIERLHIILRHRRVPKEEARPQRDRAVSALHRSISGSIHHLNIGNHNDHNDHNSDNDHNDDYHGLHHFPLPCPTTAKPPAAI